MRRLALTLAIGCHAAPAPMTGCDDLQRAVDRGGRVELARSCRLSRLVIAAPVELDLGGATLQIDQLRVVADHVAIRHGTIDGGGTRGWLVDWRGRAGVLDDVTVQHAELGVSVTDGELTAHHAVARGNDIGFRVGAGALIADDCRAEANAYAGFFVSQTAAPTTVIDATTARNGIGIAIDGLRGGRIVRLVSRDDDRFGLLLDHRASHWQIDRVRVEDPGRAARNPSGTGVELFAGNADNTFAELVVRRAAGYGLAIAGGSHDNRFDQVTLDARGAWDGDPGLVIAGGSARNQIDHARILGHTIGVRIGENDLTTDPSNDDNHLGTVYIEGARYNAIRFERGSHNTITHATIADSDSSGSDADGFHGAVNFANDSSANRIGTLVQADAARVPDYLVYAGPCALATCLTATPTDNAIDHVTALAYGALSRGLISIASITPSPSIRPISKPHAAPTMP